jgi:hypothetical protein
MFFKDDFHKIDEHKCRIFNQVKSKPASLLII